MAVIVLGFAGFHVFEALLDLAFCCRAFRQDVSKQGGDVTELEVRIVRDGVHACLFGDDGVQHHLGLVLLRCLVVVLGAVHGVGVVGKWGNLGHHDFNVAAFAEPLQVVAWIPSLDWLVRAKIGVANPGKFLAVDDAGVWFHECGVGSCLSTPLPSVSLAPLQRLFSGK